jgi:hypothetical protein
MYVRVRERERERERVRVREHVRACVAGALSRFVWRCEGCVDVCTMSCMLRRWGPCVNVTVIASIFYLF